MRTTTIVLIAWLTVIVRPGECSTPVFAKARGLNSGTNSVALAVGDLNGDGRADLAVVAEGSYVSTGLLHEGSIAVLMGNGDGTFQPAVFYQVGVAPNAVLVGDFNSDHKLDLAVVNSGAFGIASPFSSISILTNKGDGSFARATTIDLNDSIYSAQSVCLGDFDGDGKLDLAVASEVLTVWFGNGDGTFNSLVISPTVVSSDPSPGIYGIIAQDFNRDGLEDLAVSADSGISILLGTSNGRFRNSGEYELESSRLFTVAGDLNHDGNIDLIDATSGSVLLGNGDGTFKVTPGKAHLDSVRSAALLDANGDGLLDVAIGTGDWIAGGALVLLLQRSDGSFRATETNLPENRDGVFLAVGDFNNNGQHDLAYTAGSTNVSVLVNTGSTDSAVTFGPPVPVAITGSFAAGDLNADGKLDVIALIDTGLATFTMEVLLGNGDGTFQKGVQYETGGITKMPIRIADVNRDGKIDVILGTDQAYVFLGNGDGTFQTLIPYVDPAPPDPRAVADVNRDGKVDLVTILENENGDQVGISISLNNGDGTYRNLETHYLEGFTINSITAADLNGDGNPDLIGITGSKQIVFLLGNGDGTFQQPFSFGGMGNLSEIAVGDFNNDGRPDIMTISDPVLISDGLTLWINTSEPSVINMSPAQTGTGAVLSWSGASTNYAVESSTALAPGSWKALDLKPTLQNGQWQVTVPLNENHAYFRLHKL